MNIRKILIANRGEIAIRIMRTCKLMGIRTVAIYSDADVDAPHVRFADEAYHVGRAPAAESYLDKAKVIAAAQQSRADAIHPGYGFLSENAEFVSMVEEAGITFIGPSSKAIRLLGDKTSARRLAKSLKIPMVPGIVDPVGSLAELKKIAAEIGYPVLLKASAGGGGKGMRVVRDEEGLASALRGAQSEAKSSFGDDRVYVERYLVDPRHVEVQVLGDNHGNVIHLGERECSIQRRHQKIVEESPSLLLDDKLRKEITSCAVKLAKEGGYANAGTVEFLLDAQKRFYFMEMNTRLQVEHPVTELRTGIDLVREQIHVASGEPLRMAQKDVTFQGHAIECRLYAEDSTNNFFPSTGTILSLKSPSGLGIREDRGVEEGGRISAFYDPMISKVIGFGMDRDDAIHRLVGALSNYELFGVKNNIDLCLWILNHPKYRANEVDTNFIQNNFSLEEFNVASPELFEATAIAASLAEGARTPTPSSTHPVPSQWRTKRFLNMR
jgi:acetyl-CoA carboxylase biotin carboxylase subunit